MLAPGLANAVLVQECWLQGYQTCAGRCAGAAFGARGCLGPFWALSIDFGGLLEKHLFLGRRLLWRLQGYETCAGAGMLAPGLANVVLVQHLVLIGRVEVGRLKGW